MTIKIGINGMGRIGRMIVRSIIENQNRNLKIQHINNRSNTEATCKLLKLELMGWVELAEWWLDQFLKLKIKI